MSKYGLYFGEFYPPTIAHTTLAHFMLKKLKLNKVLFIPIVDAFDKSVVSKLIWKATDSYHSRSMRLSTTYDDTKSLLWNIIEIKKNHNTGVKNPRKYVYLCGLSHSIKLVNDPDYNQIKNEVDIQVMCGHSNVFGGNYSTFLDPIYFNKRTHVVPDFKNEDAAILALLKSQNYDVPYLQQQLDPAVLREIKEKKYFV